MKWLGLGFLITYVVSKLGEAAIHFERGIERAYEAEDHSLAGREMEVEEAAREIARGVGVLLRLILEAIVVYAVQKGVGAVVRDLKKSRLGAQFAAWVEQTSRSWTSGTSSGKGAPARMAIKHRHPIRTVNKHHKQSSRP